MNNICGLFGITKRVVCIFFRFMFFILINKNEINHTKEKKKESHKSCVYFLINHILRRQLKLEHSGVSMQNPMCYKEI